MRHAANGGEIASKQDHSICLNRQRPNCIIGTDAGIETGIKMSIRVQAREAGTVRAIDAAERAADQNLAVLLGRYRKDRPVDPSSRIEAGVQSSIGMQPRHAVISDVVDARKLPTKNDRAGWLEGYRKDRIVCALPGIEFVVNLTRRFIVDDGDDGIGVRPVSGGVRGGTRRTG